MQLGQAPDHREAEAGAGVLARERRVDLHEGLEEHLQVGRRDADARIGDAQLEVVAPPRVGGREDARARLRLDAEHPLGRHTLHGERHAAALGRELEGVGDEVVDDLLGLAHVQAQVADARRALHVEPHARGGGALAQHRHRAGREQLRIGAFEFEDDLARLDLRQVEDVVDEGQQVLAAAVDVFHVLLLLGAQRPGEAVFHDLGETDDRVERRAQLVAHVGEELALHAVGPLQLGVLALDVFAAAAQLLGEQAHLFEVVEVVERHGELGRQALDELAVALAERAPGAEHQHAQQARLVLHRAHQHRGRAHGGQARLDVHRPRALQPFEVEAAPFARGGAERPFVEAHHALDVGRRGARGVEPQAASPFVVAIEGPHREERVLAQQRQGAVEHALAVVLGVVEHERAGMHRIEGTLLGHQHLGHRTRLEVARHAPEGGGQEHQQQGHEAAEEQHRAARACRLQGLALGQQAVFLGHELVDVRADVRQRLRADLDTLLRRVGVAALQQPVAHAVDGHAGADVSPQVGHARGLVGVVGRDAGEFDQAFFERLERQVALAAVGGEPCHEVGALAGLGPVQARLEVADDRFHLMGVVDEAAGLDRLAGVVPRKVAQGCHGSRGHQHAEQHGALHRDSFHAVSSARNVPLLTPRHN